MISLTEVLRQHLLKNFGEGAPTVTEELEQLALHCTPESLRQVVGFLKESPELSFIRIVDITAVDLLPLGTRPRFTLVYHLHSFALNAWLRIKVPVDDDQEVPTITDMFPAANWYEREVFDMFGIRFSGHPNLQRILMPDDWIGHPLRKDYPLGAERIPFTHHLSPETPNA